MGQSIPLGTQLGVGMGERAAARADATSIPWTIWCMVAGIASGMVGGIWDISWHMSIGRDTFWTPAHIAIQMTGVLVGIACGYLILSAILFGLEHWLIRYAHKVVTVKQSIAENKIWKIQRQFIVFRTSTTNCFSDCDGNAAGKETYLVSISQL